MKIISTHIKKQKILDNKTIYIYHISKKNSLFLFAKLDNIKKLIQRIFIFHRF